jgi:hypothetical protein
MLSPGRVLLGKSEHPTKMPAKLSFNQNRISCE